MTSSRQSFDLDQGSTECREWAWISKRESPRLFERNSPRLCQTPARQWCQALEKGEPGRITQCDSSKCGTTLSIQFPNDRNLYLLRKHGHRLGWPIWPKVRFKSHAQNRWKSRFRMLSRRSIRFAPRTDSCKLSRDAYRFRALSCLLYTSDAADE